MFHSLEFIGGEIVDFRYLCTKIVSKYVNWLKWERYTQGSSKFIIIISSILVAFRFYLLRSVSITFFFTHNFVFGLLF